eukprot:TRINITY_DN5454_c0_g2_i1.p1 TRINITY_DN5454_c0_g2~~TRINITY_DN5454_c0_g2_i1.p1  ORF type:complete len:275 (-),score=81.63 TRINITY_DN5454_c0_g2_i1:23-847(-)
MAVVPFFYVPAQMMFSLAWPTQDIEYGEPITREPKLPLNDFANQDYWERRYQVETETVAYDWYLSFEEISPILCNPREISNDLLPAPLPYATPSPVSAEFSLLPAVLDLDANPEILVVGCGNAPFSAALYDAGFHQVRNVDYAPSVITQMQHKYQDRPEMTWHVADATNMSDPRWVDASIDVALDKGCIDAMMDGENGEVMAVAELRELKRLVKPGTGYLVLISLGGPDSRVPVLEAAGWQLEQYLAQQTHKIHIENELSRVVLSVAHVYICRN